MRDLIESILLLNKSINYESELKNMNNGYRMDNGMIEDDYFTFERDNITYHFFHKPTQKTEKGQYGILAVDYGIRFDKEPYKDEKGHTVIPMSRVHSKPQQVAYFEFTEDSHPEIVEAMMEEDRKEYRDLIVAETQKHTKETIDEEFVNEDEFDSYISGIFERLKSINADMDDIEGKVTDDRLCLAFYSNIDKKESSKFSNRAEKLITDYLENETRFNDWIEIYITPADKFFYNTHNDNLKSFVVEIKAESSQDFNQHNISIDEDYVEDLVVGKKYYFTNRGEVYHAKFKEKTPTWLVFVDDNGETIYTNHWVDISTSKKDLLDTPNNPYEKDSEDKKSKKDFEIDDKEVAEISDDDKKKEFKDKANAILSKVISGVKACGGSIRNIDRNFDEDSFRLTIVCSVSEAKEDRFEDTIELSIKSNLRNLISAKDLTISVFNKMASKDNNINYYISVEGKDWRSKLTEANELEQDVEMFYDRQLRLWTIYLKDEEGNQISNTEYAPNRKEALYIANNKGLFTMREDLNTPNQHNKSLDESNELKQRARKHSKKQKGMSPFISLDAGNVEKGIEVFNSSVADGSGMAMCEDMDKQTYHYEGPIYYNGHKEASKTDIYTRATSIRQAKNNIIYRISGGKDMYKFDIVDNQIEEVIDDNYEEIPHDPHNKCDICGNLLNNNNECPRCDYGEYDLDESIQVDSNLDAMAQLNRLD